jgi:hypothetical protein
MIEVPLLRFVAMVVIASTVLTACDPMPGRVLDARNIRAGALQLQVQLLAEGDWLTPTVGQHFALYCRNLVADSEIERRWQPVGSGFEQGSRRREAPVDRVVTDNSGFFLTDLFGGATFSFGDCRDTHTWGGRLPDKYTPLYAHVGAPGYIHEVHFCTGGSQLALQIEPAVFTDHRIVWVTSQDAGETWEVSEHSPPALVCQQSERRLTLGTR